MNRYNDAERHLADSSLWSVSKLEKRNIRLIKLPASRRYIGDRCGVKFPFKNQEVFNCHRIFTFKLIRRIYNYLKCRSYSHKSILSFCTAIYGVVMASSLSALAQTVDVSPLKNAGVTLVASTTENTTYMNFAKGFRSFYDPEGNQGNRDLRNEGFSGVFSRWTNDDFSKLYLNPKSRVHYDNLVALALQATQGSEPDKTAAREALAYLAKGGTWQSMYNTIAKADQAIQANAAVSDGQNAMTVPVADNRRPQVAASTLPPAQRQAATTPPSPDNSRTQGSGILTGNERSQSDAFAELHRLNVEAVELIASERRWNCSQGAIRDAQHCLGSLQYLAGNGKILWQYEEMPAVRRSGADPRLAPQVITKMALQHPTDKVVAVDFGGTGNVQTIPTGLAFDAGFTTAYMLGNKAQNVTIDPAALPQFAQQCMEQTNTVGICAKAGYALGKRAYQDREVAQR